MEIVAGNIANQINNCLGETNPNDLSTEEDEKEVSREVTADELSSAHRTQICTVASKLSGIEFTIDQCCEAIEKLRELGFEVRVFKNVTYAFGDKRLKESPDRWLFDQISENRISPTSATTEELIMICEVREKPDVMDEQMWIQKPYPDDPFAEELKILYKELDRDQLVNGKIFPESRGGFTYTQLENIVLPRFSNKAGLKVVCMPQIYVSVLANDHPEIGNGRSTEWRSDKVDENHVMIGGRSERGPVRFVYYDWKEDPYPNRGFRVCIVLEQESA
ncbi:MAG: hypothetical protein ACD_50C00028G0003 [uncultured bacterium]|nr:MAG: hypothetical protein ACD_50C00028G0003 [uncultured bacterium]